MIGAVMLLEKRRDNSESKQGQNEPCDKPIATTNSATPLRNVCMGITPVLTALVSRVDRILPWWKAHFFSPSVNYTKFDGNANEPCMVVRNGSQGQMRVSAP